MSCVDLCETMCNEVYSLGKVVGLEILPERFVKQMFHDNPIPAKNKSFVHEG